MPTQIQIRRDTTANWSSNNPTPGVGEPCLETDTGRLKFGNGSDPWNSLVYFTGNNIQTIVDTSDTLALADTNRINLYTAAGAVTVNLANVGTGVEVVLVALGAGGLTVSANGMSFANSFTPKLTIAQGEALFLKQTAASTWLVLGGTAT